MAIKSQFLGSTIKSALAVGGLAILLSAPSAEAVLRLNTTAGTSCKGSSGFGAVAFYFSNQTAENTTGSGQYLTCNIPTVHNSGAVTPNRIEILFSNNEAVAKDITCALQVGYEIGSSSSGVSTAIYNIALPASGYAIFDASSSSTPALPISGSGYNPYTLSCLIPSGAKMGVIAVQMPGSLTPDV